MKKIIKDILILCIITVICGGVLGYVYQITLSPIEKQAQQSQQDAYLEVMKEATSFKEINSKEINKLAKQLKNNYGKNGITIEKALKFVDELKLNEYEAKIANLLNKKRV